ncbi:predicted protein [Uncinocarpus reesii 1704]|uniref:ATP-dependent RNA helicase n=1 Tax=Uncinocarpus reesii (strain UAMH 1704) TaxID=336963 RepID=C4JIU1_UNCRE|nr:uncharacterized protein UREG_02952 [Uncinocarpus reesii 1704]EEP78103.1 predicted protein [Uncinocarpus reesii 1704]
MSAPFYSRYIPPSSLSSTPVTSPKRKKAAQDAPAWPAAETTHARTKATKDDSIASRPTSSTSRSDQNPVPEKKTSKSTGKIRGIQSPNSPPAGPRLNELPENSKQDSVGQDDKTNQGVCKSRPADESSSPLISSGSRPSPQHTEPISQHLKRKRKPADEPDTGDSALPTKHAKIISKYEKYTAKAPIAADARSPDASERPIGSHEETPVYGLSPLPQPAPAPESSRSPSYATLPEWLAHPLIVSSDAGRPFTDLGLHSKQISALASQGYSQAMPVQSAVIPLALNGKHDGDICISAATGSGKTLSYVLPLISTIEPFPVGQLRALIVVPTRELVKQVRKTCDLFVPGTGLRIGTAVGSTALRSEQSLLTDLDQAYDPRFLENNSNIFTSNSDWANFNLQDYISESKELHDALPNHLSTPFANVDILWVVIDEADRLLNESFQEWASTVIPAIESKSSYTTSIPLNAEGSSVGHRSPRKIILSATMTKDVSKLNSLRLRNPKFLEVHATSNEKISSQGTIGNTQSECYQLPTTLNEIIVPVGDGSDKPLVLLELMISFLNCATSTSTPVPTKPAKYHRSSSESSDSFDNDLSCTSPMGRELNSHHNVTCNSKPTTMWPSALIFTKSSENAGRLGRLLTLVNPDLADKIGVLVKSNKSNAARKTLAAYQQGKVRIIIATDRASRGLDLPFLEHVISYDIPLSATSYIHRVGRTARAGQQGTAWSLVTHNEGRWFSNEIIKGISDTAHRSIKRTVIKPSTDSALQNGYASALKKLEEEVLASGQKVEAVLNT